MSDIERFLEEGTEDYWLRRFRQSLAAMRVGSMSLTEAVEQIRRKPRSERLSGEFNTPELRKRDAEDG